MSRALAVELATFSAFVAVWLIDDGAPHGSMATVALSLTAIALGIQSATIQRFGERSLSTTYFTGTLTTVVIELAHTGRVSGSIRNVKLLGALILGAAGGGLAVRHLTLIAPLGQLLLLGLVLVLAPNSNRFWTKRSAVSGK